jgi:cardiolipin synthase A/B
MENAAVDHRSIPVASAAKILARATVVPTAKAPVESTLTGVRMCWERTRILLHEPVLTAFISMPDEVSPLPVPGDEAFESLLDGAGLPKRSAGRVKFLVDGPPFFRELHRAIEGARRSIDFQFYIFDNDQVGVAVARQLKQKSTEVPVRVLFDAIGSDIASKMNPPLAPSPEFKSVAAMMSDLSQNSEVKVRATSNPYLVSDHSKLVVVDDRTAFIGGMNVAAEYRLRWHDMMERIEGPVVQQLSRIFDEHWSAEDWRRHWGLGALMRGRSSPDRVAPNSAELKGHAALRILVTDLLPGRRDVLKATLAAIRCARERVWIETPYFAVDEITAELERAVERGVDVRVIIPGKVDAKFMRKVNLVELRNLLTSGAKVYEYPGMTHLKATICDGWATFGSANYDTLSMRINRELNVATADPATVEDLIDKVFKPDLRVSSRLTIEAARARGGPLTEILGDQL